VVKVARKQRKSPKPEQAIMFFASHREARERPSTEVVPFDFEGNGVRGIRINGEAWLVAKDVCDVLGLENNREAISSLDEDEKNTVRISDGNRGNPNLTIISESGLYALVFKSRKPEAKRFRKWVTSEVLPILRKTGSYSLSSKAQQIARRNRCDATTAKIREKSIGTNKHLASQTIADGGGRQEIRDKHNAIYLAQFGMECSGVREAIGIPHWKTPLDYMDAVTLSVNNHAKTIAAQLIENAEKSGSPVPLDEQSSVYEEMGQAVTRETLAKFGPGADFAAIEHPRRGKILAITQGQLPA
jgi:prophage antirepressor-like protein